MINFQPVPGKLGHSDHGLWHWQARGADFLLVRVMKLVDVGVVVVVHRNSSYNSTNGDNH